MNQNFQRIPVRYHVIHMKPRSSPVTSNNISSELFLLDRRYLNQALIVQKMRVYQIKIHLLSTNVAVQIFPLPEKR